MTQPQVDTNLCTGCKRCLNDCNYAALEQVNGKVRHRPGAYCTECGHCVAVCPVQAVTLPGLSAAPDVTDRLAPEALESLMATRRSVRRFADRPVDRALIERLLQAASLAPSGCNARPVQVTAIDDPAVLSDMDRQVQSMTRRLIPVLRLAPVAALIRRVPWLPLRRMADPALAPSLERILRGPSDGWRQATLGAPVVLLFHANPTRPSPGEDCVIAADHVSLLAVSLGLGNCWNGLATLAVNRFPTIRRRLGLPDGEPVFASLCVGWPAVSYVRGAPRRPVPVRWV